MIQANTLIAGAAAIALLLGVTGQGTIPKELRVPLSNKDIVIVKDEAQPSIGQSDATVKQSAEMGKADGFQAGERQGNVPKSRSESMTASSQTDQDARSDTARYACSTRGSEVF
jgi:hypothetical protein